VTTAALEEFKEQYKEGEEERADLLASYASNEGNMDAVFESVMLSNPLEDEERFRAIIDSAIKNGEVEAFDAFTKESKRTRKRRADNAKKEAAEAREMAKELGVEDQLFGAGNKKSSRKAKDHSTSDSALAALIQQRQQSRSEGFLDRLEQKYASSSKPSKRKKVADEPPGELFAKNAKKRK
jgi:DnaJ family protein C protein 9